MTRVKELYCIDFPNGKKYIGISFSAKGRFCAHQRHARRGDKNRVCMALRKYPDAIMRVLVIGEPKYIEELEICAISNFNTCDGNFGYNISSGGGYGAPGKRTKEQRAKMSRGQKRRVRTPEEIAGMSRIAKMRKMSPEYKQKLRAAAFRRWERVNGSELKSNKAWQFWKEQDDL